ncbi:MAG: ABC transporter ATP-binding protein [Candidatus Acetothermia bacterium]
MKEVLRTEGLSRKFGGVEAVSGVDFSVEKGQAVGVIGPNGAGKTTLFNLISGFLRPSTGEVYYRGERITDWSVHRRVEEGLTRTFQVSKVFPRMSVRENVLTGTYTSRGSGGLTWLVGEKDKKGGSPEVTVERIMEVTKLDGYEDRLAMDLSYGYRRRLELAVALATDPRLLLLDEPFSGTNPLDLDELVNLLKLLNEGGVTILVVEHDLGSIINLVDRLIYMDSGRMVVPGESSSGSGGS